jgi:branched-chain amino acid transport system substrate-binding protein
MNHQIECLVEKGEEKMNKRNISRRDFVTFVSAIVVGTILGFFPSIVGGAPNEILIGAIYPMTGVEAEGGQMNSWGLELAAEHVNNAGGIKSMGGAKVKLVIMDSESKNEVGAMLAEKLIQRGIVCLTGAKAGGVTMAVSKVADRHKMPFVINSTADQITQQGFENVVRIFPTISQLIELGIDGIVEVTRTKAIKTAVWMNLSSFHGKSTADSFFQIIEKKNLSWNIVKKITYPENPMSIATEVSEAKALKPDAIFICALQRDAIMLVQEMYKQRFNVDGIFGIVSPGFATPGFHKERLSDYAFNTTPWHDQVQPFAKKVAEEYESRFKKPFNMDAAVTYDAMLVMADALERAGKTEKEALLKALKATRLERKTMVGGPIEFDEKGDNKGARASLMQLQQGKSKIVYPPFAATAKAIYPVLPWDQREIK